MMYESILNHKLLKDIDIMDYFNFEKVHKVMTFLEWKWYNSYTATGVPSIPELRTFAREQIWYAVNTMQRLNETEYTTFCGGLQTRTWIEDGKIYVSIQFILEGWDNFD
jgi:hypothetical protein